MFKSTKIVVAVMVCFAIMAINSGNAFAGGIPDVLEKLDSIQETLDSRVIPKLDQCCEGEIGVPKTGQTDSYGDDDDGDLQNGIAWPVPRFTDNYDGTVTDNLTNLIWLKDANCFERRTWSEALNDCNNLASGECDLTDDSVARDWRLPNFRELHSLIDFGNYKPALPSGYPFDNVQSAYYWSSTTYATSDYPAWAVSMYSGYACFYPKDYKRYVWPVRGGN